MLVSFLAYGSQKTAPKRVILVYKAFWKFWTFIARLGDTNTAFWHGLVSRCQMTYGIIVVAFVCTFLHGNMFRCVQLGCLGKPIPKKWELNYSPILVAYMQTLINAVPPPSSIIFLAICCLPKTLYRAGQYLFAIIAQSRDQCAMHANQCLTWGGCCNLLQQSKHIIANFILYTIIGNNKSWNNSIQHNRETWVHIA